MIRDTMAELEQRIQSATGASEETRKDLLALLAELRAELESLGETHEAQAQGIARRARAVANDTAPEPDETDASEGLWQELEDAVQEFDASHPRLVGVLRSFFKTLSDAGI